ncbi:MAG: putative manganese-dependent inorganic diphosphatase [bacterium]|nr:putative manganese-dependent inorganic diphosphatase [bacterium]
MKDILVIGHKNPDTDSVCSAYAYAALKAQLGGDLNFQAARAGNLNKQTRYIFDKFKVEPPPYVKDVYPKAQDVMTREVSAVSPETPLMQVMQAAEMLKIRSTPVVDDQQRLQGLINMLDITHFFLKGSGEDRPKYLVRPENLKQVLRGTCLQEGQVQEMEAHLIAGAMSVQVFGERFAEEEAEACVLVVGFRERLIKDAFKRQIPVLILTGVTDQGAEALRLLNGFKGWVFLSEDDTADTLRKVALATPAKSIMSAAPSLRPGDYLEEAAAKMEEGGYKSLPVVDEAGRLMGILSKSDMMKKEPRRLILMDHNEMTQAVDGAEGADILEIVDHHRLGTIKTKNPVHFYAKPVGSTCTLVYQLYKIHGQAIDQTTASLLLCGVLTDTVILKSPTATDEDRVAIDELCQIAGQDYQQLGIELFSATDSLASRSPLDVINTDFKKFEEYGAAFGIGQVEVVTLGDLAECEAGLHQTLEEIKQEKGLVMAMLLVTDIIKETSILLTTEHEGFAKTTAYKKLGPSKFDLPGVLSRKKQLLPEALRVFEELA